MLVARRWWSRIDVCAHAPRASSSVPSAVSWVLHRDGDVLVVDKPAGVPMRSAHGVRGVDAFLADLRFDLAHPPMTVHRLDRDTTGCLILARTREAQRTLAGYFQLKCDNVSSGAVNYIELTLCIGKGGVFSSHFLKKILPACDNLKSCSLPIFTL